MRLLSYRNASKTASKIKRSANNDGRQIMLKYSILRKRNDEYTIMKGRGGERYTTNVNTHPTPQSNTCTRKEHLSHQKLRLECPYSVGDTTHHKSHTEPLHPLLPQACDKNSEALPPKYALSWNAYAHQLRGTMKGGSLPST